MEWLSQGIEVLNTGLGRNRGESPPKGGFDFDAVIIGSGYGGSVAASRLARAGLSVCVLERGREYVPGEFPDDLSSLPGHVRLDRADSSTLTGKADGLFDIRVGKKMLVLVGSALGGTSQINANVAIRADPAVFKQEAWPDKLRLQEDPLDTWYTLAEEMLGVSPMPAAQLPEKYRQLEKLLPHLQEHVWRNNGWRKDFAPEVKCYPAKLAVTFDREQAAQPDAVQARQDRPRTPNAFGVGQSPCVGCGECVTGCNYWAKNTLTMNYLPDAYRHQAQLYTGVTVVAVQPESPGGDDGFTVYYRATCDRVGEPVGSEEIDRCFSLRANIVVLAAGPLGSVEILMRSQVNRFLQLSPRLGKGFSGNGDALAFGFDQREPVRAVGWGRKLGDEDGNPLKPVGPTITGIIDTRPGVSLREGHLVQDGIIPGPIARLVHEALTTSGTLAQMSQCDFHRDGPAAQTDPLALEPKALDRTQAYLTMGHDEACGELVWESGRVIVRWPGERPLDAVERGYALAECSRALGAIALRNPLHQYLSGDARAMLSGPNLDGPALTVHPLGGCAMGDDFETGVVDHCGAVFNGVQPQSTYLGLYVMDGSVMPTALGANPFLTITALAERNVALLIERRAARLVPRLKKNRLASEYALPEPRPGCAPPELTEVPPPPAVPERECEERPRPISFRLKEGMRGRWQLPGEVSGENGKLDPMQDANVSLSLRFEIADFDKFLRDPRHALGAGSAAGGSIRGTLRIKKKDKPETDEYKVVGGSVEILSRLPSWAPWRMLLALKHWYKQRGHDEICRAFRASAMKKPSWRERLRSLLAYLRQVPLLLIVAKHSGEARAMPYRLKLVPAGTQVAAETKVWTLVGAKRIAFESRRNLWSSLGHLQNVVVRDAGGNEVAQGELMLDMIDFTEQETAQLRSHADLPNAFSVFSGYPLLFLRVVLKAHLLDFRAPDYPAASRPRQLFIDALAAARPEDRSQYWFTVPEWERADENRPGERGRIPLSLTRFCPPADRGAGKREPVLLLHGFAQSTLAFGPDLSELDHETNQGLPDDDERKTRGNECLANFLFESGFDVWLLDYRHSIALESVRGAYDLDLVALVDIPCAVDFILAQLRKERGLAADHRLQIAAFGHCMGGATLAMALLSGRLCYENHKAKILKPHHDSKILKAVISQVPPFIVGGAYSQWRRELAAFLRDWVKLKAVNFAADDAATPIEAIADRLLASLPVDEGEVCWHEHDRVEPRTEIATCKRISGIIGPLFRHQNLHRGTHRQLHRYFGLGNIEVFAQIGKFFDYERLVSSDGDNAYLTEQNVIDHLELPIRFLHGEENRTFNLESARRSIAHLGRINGGNLYDVILATGTGHFDCIVGKHARRKVFKPVRDFLRSPPPQLRPVDLDCLEVKLPQLGPIIGWTRLQDGKPLVRLWVKVDDCDTEPAVFLLTAVREKSSGRLLEDFVQAWPILVSEGRFGPSPDCCGDLKDKRDRERNKERDKEPRRVHPDLEQLYGTLALADVELPDASAGYEIIALTAHRVASRDTKNSPPTIRGLIYASAADLLRFDKDGDAAQPKGRRASFRRRYAEDRERMNDDGWLLRMRRDPLDWFEPEAGDEPRRRFAEDLIGWLKKELNIRRARRGDPARILSRATRKVRKFKECVADVPAAAFAPAAARSLRFLAGTCRYPGLDLDRERSDAALGLALAAAREKGAAGVAFMLMLGDQIYADYTGGAFETQSSVEKYMGSYAAAFSSPGFRALARRLPHYMAIDDHEIDNDWSLDQIARAAHPRETRRHVRRAIATYDAFQSVHGPRLLLPWRSLTVPGEDRVPFRGFAAEFSAGGFDFFVMDTRTQRRRREDRYAPRIANDQQIALLCAWLGRDTGGRPKFVLSGSVFFPGIDEYARGAGATRMHADTWQAFRETQQRVLEAIAARPEQKVVFISGDYHCAAIAEGRLVRRRQRLPGTVVGLVVPPFYAPLPFANLHPGSVIGKGVIGSVEGLGLEYTTDPFGGWAGFGDLRVYWDAGAWKLDVRFRYADNTASSKIITL